MLFVYGYHKLKNKIKATLQVWQNIFLQRPRHKQRAVLSVSFQGSFTVEAALILPIFLLVICGFLRFFVLINYQNILQSELENTARYLGSVQYITKDSSKITNTYAYLKVISGKAGRKAEDVGIKGGKQGLSMMQSDISGDNNIKSLVADYQWSTSFLPGGDRQYLLFVQRCSYIPWTGESLKEKNSELTDETVFITPSGSVYHKSRKCTYLTRCIKKVRFVQIPNMRNKGGGKYLSCERCVSGASINKKYVYITDYGDRFHLKKECNTLIRYIKEVKLLEVQNRKKCSKCF